MKSEDNPWLVVEVAIIGMTLVGLFVGIVMGVSVGQDIARLELESCKTTLAVQNTRIGSLQQTIENLEVTEK